MDKKNRFMIIVDGSYLQYFVIFGAASDFQKSYPDEASVWIKPAEECDQENLPDILGSQTFRRLLKQYMMKRLETVESIARQNFQDVIDSCDGIDIVFAMDDKLKKNFRLEAYPQYKANRLLVKRQYRLQPIKDYIQNVLFKELDVEGSFGYRLVKVNGAEGDDVIATAIKDLAPDYAGAMLIASDHDFLQIDGVREFDLFGKEAKRELGGENVSASDFLLGKILMGDRSDNIKQVFAKCGPKTALKFVKDKGVLKKMLEESQESASRFLLNKKLISFDEMPKDLRDSIKRTLNEKLYRETAVNGKNLKDFMDW